MKISEMIERFAKNAEKANCGIGSKGFERGNKCAVSKGGSKAAEKSLKSPKPAKETASAKAPKKAEPAKAPSPKKSTTVDTSKKTANPPLPASSDSSAKPTKESSSKKFIGDLMGSPKMQQLSKSIMAGNVPKKDVELSAKALKSLAHHKPVTADMHRIADENEIKLAKATKGLWLPDNEAVDVIVDTPIGKVGLEMKTTFDNSNAKLTIDAAANFNKVNWVKEGNGKRIDIVILDNNTGALYYKRGVGSYRVDSMHKAKSMKEIHALALMDENDPKFPEKAKYPTNTANHKAIHDDKAYNDLAEKADAAKAGKDARRVKSETKAAETKIAEERAKLAAKKAEPKAKKKAS